MTHLDYLDFDIEIGLGQGRDYPLASRSSPGGEAQEVLHFPLDEIEIAPRAEQFSAVRQPDAVKPVVENSAAAQTRGYPTQVRRSPLAAPWHDAARGVAGAFLLLLLLGLASCIGKISQPAEQAAASVTLTVATFLTQQTSTAQITLTRAVDATRTAQVKITFTPTRVPSSTPLPALWEDPSGVSIALIPAGEFQMGSENGEADERPVHTVNLDAFYMDVYEVTNARYAECVQAGGCEAPLETKSYTRSSYYGDSQYADFPVIFVHWKMADAYCDWRGARLPGEAEWEKAARGGFTGKTYPWGDDAPVCQPGADNGANYFACSPDDTMAVGSFAPNGYGLYDMAGNVWEWVMDWYDVYPGGDAAASQYFGQQYRVLRGGSWLYDGSDLRTALRLRSIPVLRLSLIGFRCARSP